MSFKVEVVEIGKVGKHPNADTLSITNIFNTPVIFRTGEFKQGDKAVYIPYDAVVLPTNPKFTFLASKPNPPESDPSKLEGEEKTKAEVAWKAYEDRVVKAKTEPIRIRPKKLRNIYSEGILITLDDPTWELGKDVTEFYGITKYEEPESLNMSTDNEKAPPVDSPIYGIEPYLKNKHTLVAGEDVVVTEKLHGCNSRFLYHNGRLWVGSHNNWKKEDPTNLWWKLALKNNFSEVLKAYPDYVFYGESYGSSVQDFSYNLKQTAFAVFDIYNSKTHKYLDFDEVIKICAELKLDMVPILYRGPYEASVIEPLRLGKSELMLKKGDQNPHMREGFVIKPTKERWNAEIHRVILKYVSEDYKLRKNGTEKH